MDISTQKIHIKLTIRIDRIFVDKAKVSGTLKEIQKKKDPTSLFSQVCSLSNSFNNSKHFQPENVVCTQKENTSVKIIDFGTAKELEPTEKVRTFW